MKEQRTNRTKWLHLRLNPQEYAHLHGQFSRTTCRKISEYARKILLGKPVTTTYRNQSLDDFMSEMMQLRGELNSIGNNFNQVVKKLHSASGTGELTGWLMVYDQERKTLLDKVETIKNSINKIADKWLQ